MTYSDEFNSVYISGEVVSELTFSHELYGEKFYESKVKAERLSGNSDVLPVIISERILTDDFEIGKKVIAIGQFRSHNKIYEAKSKLELYVFIRELLAEPRVKNTNIGVFVGYIVKPPVYRKTPLGREVADIMVAVNRSYNKTDYIPMIVWGRNARFVADLKQGTRIQVEGRIQSREYEKVLSNSSKETRTAYEVSVAQIVSLDEDSELEDWGRYVFKRR